jgi:hypothetical protein
MLGSSAWIKARALLIDQASPDGSWIVRSLDSHRRKLQCVV